MAAFITLVGFTLTGPYTLMDGVLALSLGGPSMCATVSATVQATGYSGGLFTGYVVGRLADGLGWVTIWRLLAVATSITVVTTCAFAWLDRRPVYRNLSLPPSPVEMEEMGSGPRVEVESLSDEEPSKDK